MEISNLEGKSYTQTLIQFCKSLRESGIRISIDESISAAEALKEIDPTNKEQFYYALYTSLVTDPENRNDFDRLFIHYWEETWRNKIEDKDETINENVESRPGLREEKLSAAERENSAIAQTITPGNGPQESKINKRENKFEVGKENQANERSLEKKDAVFFEGGLEESSQTIGDVFDGPNLDEIEFLVKDIGNRIGAIKGYENVSDRTGRMDLRKSMNVMKEKSPKNLPRRNKSRSLVKMAMFVDVSRSMIRNIDQNFLFRFIFECVRNYTDVRIFFFDTDVKEVTAHFQMNSLEKSIEEMERARTEWGSGTRIGECIDKILNGDPFIVDRDTAVVIISDGWDAGDLNILVKRMAYIKRNGNMCIWLNPPASSKNYEPEVRGMKTALPYVDHFYGFNSTEDLKKLAERLKIK